MQSSGGKKLLKTKKKALGFLVLIIGYVFTATVGKCSALTHERRNVYLLQFRGIVVTGTLTHSSVTISSFFSLSHDILKKLFSFCTHTKAFSSQIQFTDANTAIFPSGPSTKMDILNAVLLQGQRKTQYEWG